MLNDVSWCNNMFILYSVNKTDYQSFILTRFLTGGYDGLNILNSVERYDPHTGHWTSVTPMATKRSGGEGMRSKVSVLWTSGWPTLLLRGWCRSAQWSHLCGGGLWRRFTPRLRWGLQHQNRLLDHRSQHDHASMLRGSDCPQRTTIRHRRVRNGVLTSFFCVQMVFSRKLPQNNSRFMGQINTCKDTFLAYCFVNSGVFKPAPNVCSVYLNVGLFIFL